MQLNPFERRLVAGRWRRLVLRHWDLRKLQRLGCVLPTGKTLELGFGAGYGLEACKFVFGASEVHGLDPDPLMVAAARQHLARCGAFAQGAPMQIWQGKATEILAADESYDTVLCLQVLHHVVNWRQAVAEVARVLRPGGQLLLAESLVAFLQHPILGRWMEHPTTARFSQAELVQELELAGLEVVGLKRLGSWMVWLRAVRREL